MELDNLFGDEVVEKKLDDLFTPSPEVKELAPVVTKVETKLDAKVDTKEDTNHAELHAKVIKAMDGRLHSEIPLHDSYWTHLNNLKKFLHLKKG